MYKSARCTKAAVIPHRTKVMHIYIKTSLFTKHFSVTNLFHLTDSSDTVNVKLKLMIEIGIEVLKGKIRILCYSV